MGRGDDEEEVVLTLICNYVAYLNNYRDFNKSRAKELSSGELDEKSVTGEKNEERRLLCIFEKSLISKRT